MQTWRRLVSFVLCMAMLLGCMPSVWATDSVAAAEAVTYTKVTSEAEFTTGNYVMVTSTGYAPGVLSGTWITAVQPTVTEDTVVDPAEGVWTLTVDGTSVVMTDANGVTVKPKGGNANGISSGDYSWTWAFADGTFTFSGVDADTVLLASNVGSENKFRGYKTATVSGNSNGYPSTFTLYKLETAGEDVPVETAPVVTEPVVQQTQVAVNASAVALHPGDTFTVTVSITGDIPFTSFGYVPEQESAYFEVLSGEVLSAGQTAVMSDYTVGSGGAVYFEEPTALSGEIFSITLKVRDDAPVGSFTLTAAFEGVQVRNVDDYIPFGLTEPTFTVTMPDPDDGTLLTIAEAIELGLSKGHNSYTANKIKVTGVITEVYNTSYGNMYIADADGNKLLIYGTYDADGTNRYDAMTTKPVAGDTVTIYGILGQYNGTAQIKNGWVVEHFPVETPTEPTEPEVTEPTEPAMPDPDDGTLLTITEAIELGLSKGHNSYTANKIKVTGVITEVYNTSYGNMYIADADGNKLLIYGTYDADGTNRYDAMTTKPVAGDTVTIYGILGQYNGTAQIKNGWVVEHFPVETPTEPTEPSEEPTEPSEEPTEPSEEPTEPSVEPTEPSVEPTEPSTGSAVLNLGFQTNRISYATDKVVYQANGITFTNEKASSTTNMRDAATDDHIRLYVNTLVRIEYPGMTKLVFTCSNETQATYAQGSLASLGGTITVDGVVVTLELAEPVDAIEYTALKQHRYTQVEIFGAGGSIEPTEPEVTEPSVEPTEPSVEPTEPSVEPTEPSEEPTEPSQRVEYCPHCDSRVEWKVWDGTKLTESAHVYLTDHMEFTATNSVGVNGTELDIVLDLNGYTIKSTARTFTVSYSARLSVLDSVGTGGIVTAASGTGGMFQTSKGTINIYSGKYEYVSNSVKNGGLFYITGPTSMLNIYDGTFVGGEVTGNGGIMMISNGNANILGGSFIPGKATLGDSIYVTGASAKVVIGGYAKILGGVQLGNSGTLTLTGAPVIQAKESAYGLKVATNPVSVDNLQDGAQISVTADGIFTNTFASVDDAAIASMYFTCDDASKTIMVQDQAVAVAEVTEPTEPTDPSEEPTEPTVSPDDADAIVTVTPEKTEVQQGETITVTVSIKTEQNFSSMGYVHIQNSNVFNFVSGEVIGIGLGGMLTAYDENGGVVMFSPAKAVSGDVFRFTITVGEDAPLGYTTFTEEGGISVKNGATALSVALDEMGINVVCKDHSYSQWNVYDAGLHQRSCSVCGKVETQEHNWDGGQVTVESTCAKSGVMTYTCLDCYLTRTEEIPATGEHVYGQWNHYDGVFHIRYCTGADCSATEMEEHSWDAGVMTIAPSCYQWGETTYTCTTCPATHTETIEPTYAHVCGPWYDQGDGVHRRDCTTEGCWHYEIGGHWWDGGVVTIEPNCTNSGERTYTCLDCGATYKETLFPNGVHSYSPWEAVNQQKHSHTCYHCGIVWTENHNFDRGTCYDCGLEAEYTVIFRDEDGTVISEKIYRYGDTVVVPADPVKPTDGKYIYAFAGWNREITVCQRNATYTATYEITALRADFNADGVVSDDDAYYLLRYVLFGDTYPVVQDADVNDDGMVSDADAMYLLRFVLFPNRYPLDPGMKPDGL